MNDTVRNVPVDDDNAGDAWRAFREERAEKARERRKVASDNFAVTEKAAFDLGLVLKRYSEIHYELRSKRGWRLNIYPGNLRLTPVAGPIRPPFLFLPEEWRLEDVLAAADEAESRRPK